MKVDFDKYCPKCLFYGVFNHRCFKCRDDRWGKPNNSEEPMLFINYKEYVEKKIKSMDYKEEEDEL